MNQDAREDDVLAALRRIIRAADLQSRYLERTTGMTAPQLLLLQLVRTKGKTSIGVIAREMHLSQATVTTVVDRLESRGLVVRERSDIDKRKVLISLTPDGEAGVSGAPALLQHNFIRQFRDLHDWEKSFILSALQRIAVMMDAEHLDASPLLDVGPIDREVKK
jgi:DNA-binding MarR family transcriptional regulator